MTQTALLVFLNIKGDVTCPAPAEPWPSEIAKVDTLQIVTLFVVVEVVDEFGVVVDVGATLVGVVEFECDRTSMKRAAAKATTATMRRTTIFFMILNLVPQWLDAVASDLRGQPERRPRGSDSRC